jgi:hypothetical protein
VSILIRSLHSATTSSSAVPGAVARFSVTCPWSQARPRGARLRGVGDAQA